MLLEILGSLLGFNPAFKGMFPFPDFKFWLAPPTMGLNVPKIMKVL